MTVNGARALTGNRGAPKAGAAGAGSGNGDYVYDVVVSPRHGRFRRWHGRVVTTTPAGERHHWPTRSARTRHQLIAELWEQATLDIQWRTGGGAVRLVELE